MKRVALLAVVVAVAAVGRPGSARASARAFIPCSADGTVSVIDTSTDTVTATVSVSYGATFVAIHPSGTRTYVATWAYYSDRLWVIDAETSTVVTSISLADGPNSVSSHAVATHPDGRRVYIARINGVMVLDAATNAMTQLITDPYNDDEGATFIIPWAKGARMTGLSLLDYPDSYSAGCPQ